MAYQRAGRPQGPCHHQRRLAVFFAECMYTYQVFVLRRTFAGSDDDGHVGPDEALASIPVTLGSGSGSGSTVLRRLLKYFEIHWARTAQTERSADQSPPIHAVRTLLSERLRVADH